MSNPSAFLIVAMAGLCIATAAALLLQFARRPGRSTRSALVASLLVSSASIVAFLLTYQVDSDDRALANSKISCLTPLHVICWMKRR